MVIFHSFVEIPEGICWELSSLSTMSLYEWFPMCTMECCSSMTQMCFCWGMDDDDDDDGHMDQY